MKARLNFLDNLRTFSIFLVVVLHAGLVYEVVLENNWIVIDPQKNNAIGLVRMYLDLFVMFTLFFVSGYFIPASVRKQSTLAFVASKLKRIMLPWALAVLTLIPAYKAIYLYSRGWPQEAWYTYFHVYTRTGSDLSYFSNNPTQNWLWFLPVLFLFQILYLALYKFRLLPQKLSMKQAVAGMFVLGVAAGMTISSLGMTGWTHSWLLDFQRERLPVYFLAFLLGSLSYRLNVFAKAEKNKKMYIISNVALTLSLGVYTVVALNLFFNLIDPSRNYYFISEFADKAVFHASSLASMLSFLYILLYVFRFNFNTSGRIMRPLNSSSYNVYIIHMIVLGIFALILARISMPALAKYALLTLITFAASSLLAILYARITRGRIMARFLTSGAIAVAVFLFVNADRAVAPADSAPPETESPSAEINLHEAVITGNLEAVLQAVNSGADIDVREPTGGSSPLMTAATFGKDSIAIALIRAGADVNMINGEGSSPLHAAAFFGHPGIVKALLDAGADPDVRNNAGSTPLETVLIPFEVLEPVYESFGRSLAPLGLEIDYESIRTNRPVIADMLMAGNSGKYTNKQDVNK